MEEIMCLFDDYVFWCSEIVESLRFYNYYVSF